MMRVTVRLIFSLLVALTFSSCRMGGTERVGSGMHRIRLLPSRITILNWNAQKGQNEELPAELRGVVQKHAPHLVFLQEAKDNLWDGEESSAVFARSWKYPWPGGDTVGVLTASVVPPLQSLALPTRHRELRVTAPKVSLASYYPMENGKILLTANVHCLNFERWSTNKLQAQLDDLKRALRAHSGPVLMAGDFNTWNSRRYELVQTLARELGLEEMDKPVGAVKTGDQGGDSMNRFLGIEPDLALDRIFFRGLRFESAEVLKSDTSDHNAIVAQFSTI